jgi:hypothetical protein
MLIGFIAALAVSGAAPAASPAPLREVVYNISYDAHDRRTYTNYDGTDEQSGFGGYSGKLTVDVMQASADGLLVRVTEVLNAGNITKPVVGDVLVFSNGALKVIDGEYDQNMTLLLPYFGQDCFVGNPLQQGNTWDEPSTTADNVALVTSYDVTSVDGDLATITSSTKPASSKSASFGVESKVVYKASLLVPISLNVVMRKSGSDSMSANDLRDTYHFDRISDTRDPGK